MNPTALVARGRIAHLALMTDACVVDRASQSFNTTTGAYTVTWTTLYSGVCRLKGPEAGSATVRESLVAEAEQATQRQTLVLPYGECDEAAVGDRVTVAGIDQEYRVVGTVNATTQTARSLLVEAVDDPTDPA